MIYVVSVEFDGVDLVPVTVVLVAADNKAALEGAVKAAENSQRPGAADQIKGVTVIAAWTDDALKDGGTIVF